MINRWLFVLATLTVAALAADYTTTFPFASEAAGAEAPKPAKVDAGASDPPSPRGSVGTSKGDVPKLDLILSEATTSGAVGDTVAKMTLKIGFEALTSKPQEIAVLPTDVAVTEFKFERGRARDVQLVRTETGYVIRTTREGTNEAEIHYVARVEKTEKTRSLVLPLVQAAKAKTAVTLPGESVEVTLSPATGFETATQGADTLLTVYGATANRVTVTWKPKVELKKVEAVVFADQNTQVTVGRGVLRAETAIDYSILQGKVKQLTIGLPPDATLLSVKGEGLRTWDVAGQAAERTLTVQLLDEVSTSYKLELQLEQPIGKGALGEAAAFTVPAIVAKNVERETGAVAVIVWKGLKVEPAKTEGVTQVDVREMPAAFGAVKEQVHLAYRYLQRPITIEGKVSEVEAKVWADVTTAVRVSPETLRLSTQAVYTIKDAGIFHLSLKLPKDAKLVDLQGENINNWDRQGETLSVDLRSKAEGTYTLTLDTEQPIATIGDKAITVPISAVELVEVTRQRGYIALATASGIKIEPVTTDNIMQIDVNDLPKGPGGAAMPASQVASQKGQEATPDLAFRYLQPGYKLAVAISRIEAEVSTTVNTTLTINEKTADVASAILYDIRKAGIFQLQVAMPQGFKLLGCEGPNIDDWKPSADGKLTVTLKQKTQGAYTLRLTGKQDVKDLASVPIPMFTTIRKPGEQKEAGFVAVRADESLRLKSGKELQGLVEIDVKELPTDLQQGKVLLAYKYYTPDWKGNVAAEPIESHVTAETFTFLSLGEALLQASVTVKYTILYAGVQTFKLKIPEGATNVDINGQDIKLRDEDKKTGTWTITLQAKKKDEYRLFVTFQREVGGKEIDLKYAGVEVQDVKRETGYVAVAARSDLELAAGDKLDGLTPIDPQEIPADYRVGIDAPLLLAFRYLKHPYTLHAVAVKHDPAAVLVAVIEACLLTTTLTEDGNLITDMTCRVRNTREQSLTLTLPEGAEIWHVFVDGKRAIPVQSKEGDTLLTKVPIAGVGDSQRPFTVNLRYGSIMPPLKGNGVLSLDFPRMAIPALRLGWRVSLPDKYRLVSHNGSLRFAESLDSELRSLANLPVSVTTQADTPRADAPPDEPALRAQWDNNRFNGDNLQQMAGSVRSGRAGGQRSIYTGAMPETRNIYCFQSLIAMKEQGSIRSTYLRSSVDTVVQGALVIAAVLVVLAFWALFRFSGRFWRAGVVVAFALIVLGVRTLWEEAYHEHLTYVLWALLLTLLVELVGDSLKGVVARLRRAAAAKPEPALPAPASPEHAPL